MRALKNPGTLKLVGGIHLWAWVRGFITFIFVTEKQSSHKVNPRKKFRNFLNPVKIAKEISLDKFPSQRFEMDLDTESNRRTPHHNIHFKCQSTASAENLDVIPDSDKAESAMMARCVERQKEIPTTKGGALTVEHYRTTSQTTNNPRCSLHSDRTSSESHCSVLAILT